MKTRFVRWMVAPALLVGALAGCDGVVGGDGDAVQREEYRSASARWEAANVSSYSYVITLICSCAPSGELEDVRVTVRDGAVVSRVYERSGAPASAVTFGPYDTVEELFAAVRAGIDRDTDLLNVAYHATYGVPRTACPSCCSWTRTRPTRPTTWCSRWAALRPRRSPEGPALASPGRRSLLRSAPGWTPMPTRSPARALFRLLIIAAALSLPGCLVVTCGP